MVFPEPLAPTMAVTLCAGIVTDTSSNALAECGPSYWNVTPRNSRSAESGISRIRSSVVGSSSSFSCTSERRSSEIFASCVACTNWMNCDSGAFNCPMMYCRATIMPSVISPSMTAEAARNEITTFFVWSINVPPTSCVCPSTSPLIETWNSRAWMRSHSQRFCFSQLLSLISCMPLMSCTMLLWLAAAS